MQSDLERVNRESLWNPLRAKGKEAIDNGRVVKSVRRQHGPMECKRSTFSREQGRAAPRFMVNDPEIRWSSPLSESIDSISNSSGLVRLGEDNKWDFQLGDESQG